MATASYIMFYGEHLQGPLGASAAANLPQSLSGLLDYAVDAVDLVTSVVGSPCRLDFCRGAVQDLPSFPPTI